MILTSSLDGIGKQSKQGYKYIHPATFSSTVMKKIHTEVTTVLRGLIFLRTTHKENKNER